MRTTSLFFETCRPGDNPVMGLQYSKNHLPSLRELYVLYVVDDPSEATFAEEVFGDVFYWTKLREAPFLQDYLKQWDVVVQVKRKQKAFKAVVSEVEDGGRSALTAAKYLIEEGWRQDKTKKAVKAKVDSTSKEAANFFKDDVERLKEDGLLQ